MAKLSFVGEFGKVHSVFRRVVNIQGNDGELYSLAAGCLDNAPNTIRVVMQGREFLELVEPQSIVNCDGLKLQFGNLQVNMTDVLKWQCLLPEFPNCCNISVLQDNLAVLREVLLQYGKTGGLKDYLDIGPADRIKDVFARTLKERSEKLTAALSSQDFAQAKLIGCSLLGLGGGHTPSGDDFCAGLIGVFNMPGGPFSEEYRKLGILLAFEAEKLTTRISQALIKQASTGRLRELLLKLLSKMAAGSKEAVVYSAKKVLSIGSMSGTDLAVGIMTGLGLGIEILTNGKGGVLWQKRL